MSTISMSEALMSCAFGMILTFTGLAIIWLLMDILKYFCYTLPMKKEAARKAMPPAATIATPAPIPMAVSSSVNSEEEEIAAVITAVAASTGANPSGIRVTSFSGSASYTAASQFKPSFINNILGGSNNEKLCSKDKWKSL